MCREITHYVHRNASNRGFWFLNTLFGQVYTPQEGLDPWFFDEGLAVYYETKLQPGVGRLRVAAAGMALRQRHGRSPHQRRQSERQQPGRRRQPLNLIGGGFRRLPGGHQRQKL